MKSAYELAMERLRASDGEDRLLTAEQRKALAEVDQQLKAKLAELDIMLGSQIAAARAKGDGKQIEELERRKASETAKSRARAEADKEDIRKAAS